jgi:hypothetical protein
MKTLWHQNKWIEFSLFKLWFQEIKKCRPVLTFNYTPPIEDQEYLVKYMKTTKSTTITADSDGIELEI